jgi:hypothetical protein
MGVYIKLNQIFKEHSGKRNTEKIIMDDILISFLGGFLF